MLSVVVERATLACAATAIALSVAILPDLERVSEVSSQDALNVQVQKIIAREHIADQSGQSRSIVRRGPSDFIGFMSEPVRIRLADAGDMPSSGAPPSSNSGFFGQRAAPTPSVVPMFDVWQRQARQRLEAEKTAKLVPENKAAQKYPNEFVVTCEAGCRPGRDVIVSLVSKSTQPLAMLQRSELLQLQQTAAAGSNAATEPPVNELEKTGDIDGARIAGAFHPDKIECIAGCYAGRKSYEAGSRKDAKNDAVGDKPITLAAYEAASWKTSVVRDRRGQRRIYAASSAKRVTARGNRKTRLAERASTWKTVLIVDGRVLQLGKSKPTIRRHANTKTKFARARAHKSKWVTRVAWAN